jgi:hypothetical protein
MAAVSESIVREFFELHGFLVCQQRKYTAVKREAEEDIDFLVTNPRPLAATTPLPGILGSGDLPQIARAVVVVKGWHTEVFGPSVLTHAPRLVRFLEPKTLKHAVHFFGSEDGLTKLLVVPALPRATESREQTVALLRSKGVDAVISFATILRDLIDQVEINRNYQKSDLLQTLRILKNYDFFREPQMELFKSKRKSRSPAPSREPTAPPSSE